MWNPRRRALPAASTCPPAADGPALGGFFSTQTAIGALSRHISSYEGGNFQPMNINFGLIDP